MTFETEEVRGKFHGLPTQQQFEWCELEKYLSRTGQFIHVQEVLTREGNSEILIRVDKKLELSVRTDFENT